METVPQAVGGTGSPLEPCLLGQAGSAAALRSKYHVVAERGFTFSPEPYSRILRMF